MKTPTPTSIVLAFALYTATASAYWQCYTGAWGSAISSTDTSKQSNTPALQKCLQDYNGTAYRDNWNSYTCGGYDWFKGTRSGVTWQDPAACFDWCAPLIGDYLTRQAPVKIQCDACAYAYDSSTEGGAQCWMGFNPV